MIALTDNDPNFCARIVGELNSLADQVQSFALADIERAAMTGESMPDVVVLGPSVGAPDAMHLAQILQSHTPDVSLILVTDTLTSDLLQAALRAGVRDVLSSSFTAEQLHEAVGRALTVGQSMRDRSSGLGHAPNPSEGSTVVTVFSAKGGVGKSFVAANLAVLMAQKHARVALVDLDLQFGDQAIMLQLFPARTLADVAGSLDRLDVESVGAYLTLHRSGVSLLAAPLEPGLAETIQPATTQRILPLLRQVFQCVVVDTPALFTEHVLSALDDSDEIVFVTSLDVPSIKNTKLALQTLDMLGVGRERIRLLLNRADAQVGLRVQEVERMLGMRVDTQIASSREVPLSINQGSPLAFAEPRSPVTASLRALADRIGHNTPARAPKSRFGFKRRAS
ncbi:MAG: response regulator [Actinomycetota bacterium]